MMWELAAAAVCVLALYGYRADFERYSIFTFGVFKRVDRSVVDVEDECDESLCESEVGVGERRRWYREIVLAGLPVMPYGGGSNYYCEDHVSFEMHGQLDEPPAPRTERLKMSVMMGLVQAIGTISGLEEPPEFEDSDLEDASSNLTAGIGDAMALVPVAFLVVFMAVAISLVKPMR